MSTPDANNRDQDHKTQRGGDAVMMEKKKEYNDKNVRKTWTGADDAILKIVYNGMLF